MPVIVLVSVLDCEAVAECVRDGVTVGVADGVGVRVPVGVVDAEELLVDVPVTVRVGVDVEEYDRDMLLVALQLAVRL